MLIPTINGTEHARAVIDGIQGRPQLIGVQLGAANTTEIQALQNALVRAGKSVRTDGVLDGNTLASTYEIIRDKGGTVGGAIAALASKSASGAVQSAFSDLQSLDSLLSQVPGISLSIPSLLRDTSSVDAVVSAAQTLCSVANLGPACTIAAKVKNSLNTFFGTMGDAVPTLTSVIGLLVPGSTSTTTLPQKMLLPKISSNLLNRILTQGSYPAGTIYTYSAKLGKYRIGVPRATAGLGNSALGSTSLYQEVTASATPPANATQVDESTFDKQTGTQPFYKKVWFWAAVGGGVLATGTIIALIVHRQRVHHRSAAFERALGEGEYDDHVDGWDDDQGA